MNFFFDQKTLSRHNTIFFFLPTFHRLQKMKMIERALEAPLQSIAKQS
jgi:hypothetical protein